MGRSQAYKLATHQLIVEVASMRFRELGLDGISISDIMQEAGLTVGGFYKHFESKDSLVSEALVAAFRDIDPVQTAIAAAPKEGMRMYISETHRDNPGSGCPMAALGNDMARATDEARDRYTERVLQFVDAISKSLPTDDSPSRRAEAYLILSAAVGSVILSRAVQDPKLSKQILEGVLEQVLIFFSSKRGRK
jgi:TetR/AcrR family transcriptional regulator, transcriptional repressor for nem operon